jgi:hypothetical protein
MQMNVARSLLPIATVAIALSRAVGGEPRERDDVQVPRIYDFLTLKEGTATAIAGMRIVARLRITRAFIDVDGRVSYVCGCEPYTDRFVNFRHIEPVGWDGKSECELVVEGKLLLEENSNENRRHGRPSKFFLTDAMILKP